MSRAADAYERLLNAMDATRPECRGIELFTSDDITTADKAVLAPICAGCPLFGLCLEYAELAHPTGGYWAGKTYRNYRPRSANQGATA